MLRVARLLVIICVPLLFWMGWWVSPSLVSPENMRFLGAIFVLVWGISFHFLRRCSELSNLSGLNGREHERLVFKLGQIRLRVWWIGAIALVSSFLIWLIGSMSGTATGEFAPIAIGVLVGISLSHLIVIPGWFNEIYAFTDKVRLCEERKKRAEAALKQIADGRK